MVAIARHDNWLKEYETAGVSLFTEFSKSDAIQSNLVAQHGPWGYKAITQSVESCAQNSRQIEGFMKLRSLLPILPQCFE